MLVHTIVISRQNHRNDATFIVCHSNAESEDAGKRDNVIIREYDLLTLGNENIVKAGPRSAAIYDCGERLSYADITVMAAYRTQAILSIFEPPQKTHHPIHSLRVTANTDLLAGEHIQTPPSASVRQDE